MNLPYKSQLPVAERCQIVRGKLTNVTLPEVYRTLRWPVQTSEQVQECTFASAGFADECKLFTLLDFQLHVFENHQLAIAGAVGFGKIDGADRGGHPISILIG